MTPLVLFDATFVSSKNSHTTRLSEKKEIETKAKEAKQKILNVPKAC